MVFMDFWEWLEFTVKTLRDASLPFFIKPHPNQTTESAVVTEEFVRRYPGVRCVPATVTNAQLVEAGISCGISVYGTVVSELAYMGVPSICCSNHPAVSFDYARTARSKEEYARLLRNFQNHTVNRELIKQQACAFEYMHNHNLSSEDILLRDTFIQSWGKITNFVIRGDNVPQHYIQPMSEMAETAGFGRFVGNLYRTIACSNVKSVPPKLREMSYV